jgi:enoyl-CoA hydratase
MADRYGFTYFTAELDDDGVLWAAFNRPERRNAIIGPMHEELAPLFRRIAADRDVAAVVLTGAGDKAFCVGADFQGMQGEIDRDGYDEGYSSLMIGSADLMRAQLSVPQPVVAALNGDAIGLGATIALFCDIVYMAEEARLGDPHVKAGLVAGDGGAILWPLLLGPHRGKEFLFTGDLVTAADAHRLGLVNHVVPRADVREAAGAMARRLAAGPRAVIQFDKRLANADLLERANRLIDASLAMEAISLGGSDHKEAVAAFLEKRDPQSPSARRPAVQD